MEDLFEKLTDYSKSDMYPFHMPGHKRGALTEEKTYSIDITEIDGFDDLHHPEGVLKKLQKDAAKLYQTIETRLLINGSTCGILAAISACCSYGGKILIARNCHKAVYNGILLRGLTPVYIYPHIEPESGLNGSISPESVKRLLEANKDVQAVLVTSPTYDGVLSDIEEISRIVHAYGLPLIVDGAHGAHLPFGSGLLPESALKKGADIVIHSLHKTLPAFTQTALLHVNSQRIDRKNIAKYLAVYQTSSPSYILMAGACSCLKWLKEEGQRVFEIYEKRLLFWRQKYKDVLADTKILQLAEFGHAEKGALSKIYDYDMSKLIFLTGNNFDGEKVSRIFREKYHLQMEMAVPAYVLALSSVCDREEGFWRLCQALKELAEKDAGGLAEEKMAEKRKFFILPEARPIFTLSEVEMFEKKLVNLMNSAGFVSASSLYLYPPGIPFLLPGEIITEELIDYARDMQAARFQVRGLEKNNQIYILENEKGKRLN